MDLSGIGRTVEIDFTNNNQFFELHSGVFTKDHYLKFIRETTKPNNVPVVGGLIHHLDVPEAEQPNYMAFLKGIKILNQSNVYDFLDENAKVVIFGTTESETLEKDKAKNLTLDKDIDLSSIDGYHGLDELLTLLFTDINKMNKFKEHLKNGITYVGNDIYLYQKGDGFDTIFDAQGKDMLYLQNISINDLLFDKQGDNLLIHFKTNTHATHQTNPNHNAILINNYQHFDEIRTNEGVFGLGAVIG